MFEFYISVFILLSESPDLRMKQITALSTSEVSFTIQYEQLSLNHTVTKYYYYVVQYKHPGAGEVFRDSVTHEHSTAVAMKLFDNRWFAALCSLQDSCSAFPQRYLQ